MRLKVWVVRVNGQREYHGMYRPERLALLITTQGFDLRDGDVVELHVVG